MEVFQSRRPTVHEVTVAISAAFYDGVVVEPLQEWLNLFQPDLTELRQELDLDRRQELLELLRKLLICRVIDVQNGRHVAFVESYVDRLDMKPLLNLFVEYREQISQISVDGDDTLTLWNHALIIADCIFLYVYICVREDGASEARLYDCVPTIIDSVTDGFQLRTGKVDTITAMMVSAVITLMEHAREDLLSYVESCLTSADAQLQSLAYLARDANISERLRGEILRQSYAQVRQMVLAAPRFVRSDINSTDEVEIKDCVLDVLHTFLENTWKSVDGNKTRDPQLIEAMSEGCTMVGAMYHSSPLNANSFLHGPIFKLLDETFRQRKFAAMGLSDGNFFVMLANIIQSEETAERMYHTLMTRTDGPALTWDSLFDRFQDDVWTHDKHESSLPVLHLTCKVAQYSETARTAIAFSKWRFVRALLRSSCQRNVEASARDIVFSLLEVFARSPSIAARVWDLLGETFGARNMNQLSVPSDNSPVFLRLLAQLLDSSDLSRTAVAASAACTAPDLTPYRGYARDQLSMAVERRDWTVALPAIKFFVQLLESYAADERDFVLINSEQNMYGISKHPGWYVLHGLLSVAQPNRLLESVMSTMCDAVALADAVDTCNHDKTYNKTDLEACKARESCVFYAMRIMELVLEEQVNFKARLSEMELDAYIRCFEDHLMADGPSNYVGAVAKFIWYSQELDIPLVAVRVLLALSASPYSQKGLRAKIEESNAVRQTSTEGVILRLEARPLDVCAWLPTAGDTDEMQRIRQLREEITDLLLFNLRQVPGVNIAHVFLGYLTIDSGMENPIQPFAGQEACIDYILDMLADGVVSSIGPVISRSHPRLYELFWELLYVLCSSPLTSAVTLKRMEAQAFISCRQCLTLRRQLVDSQCPACGAVDGANQSFLVTCVANMMFREHKNKQRDTDAERVACQLHQSAWLLKIVALELHLRIVDDTVDRDRKLVAKQLLEILLPSGMIARDGAEILLLSRVLASIDYDLDVPSKAIPAAFLTDAAQFKVNGARGIHTYDISAYTTYVHENRQKLRLTEDEFLLHIKWLQILNDRYELEYATQHKFSGVRQVMEVILTSNRTVEGSDRMVELRLFDILSLEAKAHIFDLVYGLLARFKDERCHALAGQISRIIVLLIERLRLLGSEASLQVRTGTDESMLDSSNINTSHNFSLCDASVLQKSVKLPILEPGNLHFVLTAIVETILHESSTRIVRSRMYSALLHYMQLTHPGDVDPETSSVVGLTDTQLAHQSINLTNMTMMDSEEHRQMALQVGNVNILEFYGAQLVDVIAFDATSSTSTNAQADANNASAYAVLNSLLRCGRRHVWSELLTRHTENIILSIELDDAALSATLQESPDDISPLFIHEAKMALLTRIAQTQSGAFTLIHCNAISRLAHCQHLAVWPLDSDFKMGSDVMFNSVTERFQRLLVCALRLITAILSTLRGDTRNATSQVVDFLLSRLAIVNRILDDAARVVPERSTVADAETLKVLNLTESALEPFKLLSNILYHLRPHDDAMRDRLANFASRLHIQLSKLVKKYYELDMWINARSATTDESIYEGEMGEDSPLVVVANARGAILSIVTNFVLYFRMMAQKGADDSPLPVFVCGCLKSSKLSRSKELTVRDCLGLLDSKASHLCGMFEGVSANDDVNPLRVDERRTAIQQLLLVENLVYLVWQHVLFYLGRGKREGEQSEWRISEEEQITLTDLVKKHTKSVRILLGYQAQIRNCTGVDLRFTEVLHRRVNDKLGDFNYEHGRMDRV